MSHSWPRNVNVMLILHPDNLRTGLCVLFCYVTCYTIIIFFILALRKERKDSILAFLCPPLFSAATSLPLSLHLGLFCEIVLSSTPLPSHPLTSSSEHSMNPQQEICWKPPAELLLMQLSKTCHLNCSAVVSVQFLVSIESWHSYGWCRFEYSHVPILKKHRWRTLSNTCISLSQIWLFKCNANC